VTPLQGFELAFDESDSPTHRRFRTTATAASVAAMIVAAAGILGYLPGLRFLGRIESDFIPMAPSTAACLLLLGAALMAFDRTPWPKAMRPALALPVAFVTLFGLLEFLELFTGMDLSLEDRVFPAMGTLGGIPIGRMSPVTGAAVAAAGTAILLLLASARHARSARRLRHAAGYLGVVTLLIASPVLLSYLYGIPPHFRTGITPVAATSALGLLCLGIALIAAAGPTSLPMRLVVGTTTAATLSRAFVPVVVAAVVLHGSLYHVGLHWRKLNDATLTSLTGLSVVVLTVLAITRIARVLGRNLDESNRRLRESEARFRAMTQSAHDAIVTSNSDGVIVGWNPGAGQIFGYSADVAIGEPIAMLFPAEMRTRYDAAIAGLAEGEAAPAPNQTLSLTGLRKHGHPFPLEMSLSAWTSANARYYTGIMRDATERVKAEEALRESARNLREAQSIARIGSYVFDLRGDSWSGSPVMLEILGIGADFPRTAASWASVIHPEDRAAVLADQADARRAHGQFRRTYRIVRAADGAERWVLGLGRVTYGADGAPLQMVGTLQDVTERELAAQQLRRNEASLAITLQSIGDAVIAFDASGLVTRMNAMAERLTGWSIAEAAGRPAAEVFQISDAEGRPLAAGPVARVLETGVLAGVAAGTTLTSRDGRQFQIADTAAPICDAAGRMEGVVLVFNDVSEEYRVRKALADSAELLERTGELARIGGWQLDLRTNTLTWTRETYRLHDLDPDEPLTVERAIGFYTPEARPAITAAVEACIAEGTPFDLELPLVTAAGRQLWVRAQGSAVMANGRVAELHGAFQDVTERRQVADALQASEQWHRTILKTAMAGFWLVDAAGRLIEVNDAYCRMSGYSASELLAMRIDQLEAVESSESIIGRGRDAIVHGETTFESRHRRKNGTMFDVEIRIQYHAVRGGLFVTLLQDITARKRAAEALAKSEELFRMIFAEAPLGVAVIDSLTGRIVESNARFGAIAGRTAAEMESLDWMSITHPDDVQADLEHMARMNAGEIPGFTMVKRYRRPDGSYVWINMTIARMTIEAGGHPQHMCMIEDITERRRAEEELRSLSRAVEQSPASIVITDRDGRIEYVNPRFEQVSGYTREEALGNNPRILKSGTTPVETYEALWRAITGGGEWRGELCNRRKDGDLYWEFAAISGLTDETGQVRHFIAVKEDITARKRAEEEQVVLREHLAQIQKMESIGLLAGGVAHDFNNMLAAILGYAELTMLKLGTEHPAYANVDAIRTAAKRSADMTGHLLAFARKQVLTLKVLELNEVVDGILKILRRLLGENVRLVWHPGATLWQIEGDSSHLDQVLTNLAVNARDAMQGRDAVLTVSTTNVVLDAAFVAAHPGAREGEFVHLCFRDNGVGMDEATLSHLFEPFFTTKEPGKGTGLGLSTVHGIMLQHDGFIDVESAVDVGTAFHLYFPRTSARRAALTPTDPAPPHGTETILLAEDERGVRTSTTRMLQALGYRVLATRDAAEAMAVAAGQQEPIHLLLTDVIMPGMHGAELADALVALHPELKVLFMSGYAGSIISTEGILDAGVHFIQKPFSMKALADTVRETLDD